MATVPALTDRTAAERWSEVRDDDGVWGDLRPELLEAVRTILETTMEDELAAELVASRYERSPWRRDVRNGAYHRTLVTELGAETLTGVPLSAASISRLTRQLDGQVAAFHRRPIAFRACYLLVHGLWVSVRTSTRATRRVVLACYGIAADGRRELLDYRQAASESSAEWSRFLRSLVERGLDPDAVRLVAADGAGGIAAAVAEAFPAADLQRCWTHRIRNLLGAIPLGERRACLRGLRAIYRARTRRVAVAAYWRWARVWHGAISGRPTLSAGVARSPLPLEQRLGGLEEWPALLRGAHREGV